MKKNEKKSILHITYAGNSYELSRFQKKLGLKSDVLVFEPNYLFEYDYCINENRRFKMFFKFISDYLFKYDILHFHFSSFFGNKIDFFLWKMLGKKVVLHYRGSDIRGKHQIIPKMLADKIFVSTPDLLEYEPEAIWIPNPIDCEELKPTRYEKESNIITVVHAPTNRAKKGTHHIIKAVEKIMDESYDIDFNLVEGIPHKNAIELYKKADICIDQLLIGWYGNFAIECMALGKPVLVYIREDLESYLPFLPVLNTNIRNIRQNLRLLLEDRSLRTELGKKGRRYVEQVHSANRIAQKIIKEYDI